MRLSILVVVLSALSALGGTPIGTTRMQSLGYYNRAPAAVTASAKSAWQLDGRWQGYVGQQARLKAMAAHERAELNLLGRVDHPRPGSDRAKGLPGGAGAAPRGAYSRA
jgi:hypothetical protein